MTSPDPASPLGRLLNGPLRPGEVTWIGLRSARRTPMQAVEAAELHVEDGLVGDHYVSSGDRLRQVTLIQAEDLAAIAAYLGVDEVLPEQLRRNIVVRGINLLALKDRRFRLGTALIEMTGEAHPCSRMEETFGPGGYNAVRGHGGITARVVSGGTVRVGDAVTRVDEAG